MTIRPRFGFDDSGEGLGFLELFLPVPLVVLTFRWGWDIYGEALTGHPQLLPASFLLSLGVSMGVELWVQARLSNTLMTVLRISCVFLTYNAFQIQGNQSDLLILWSRSQNVLRGSTVLRGYVETFGFWVMSVLAVTLMPTLMSRRHTSEKTYWHLFFHLWNEEKTKYNQYLTGLYSLKIPWVSDYPFQMTTIILCFSIYICLFLFLFFSGECGNAYIAWSELPGYDWMSQVSFRSQWVLLPGSTWLSAQASRERLIDTPSWKTQNVFKS